MRERGASAGGACKGLIIFTRYPEPGTTKTRLIPILGEEGAARLQKNLTENVVAEYDRMHGCDTFLLVHYSGGSERLMQEWLGSEYFYRSQPQGDLGTRMAESFREGMLAGAEHILLVGSDIPLLNSQIMLEGFEALQKGEVVLGPSRDGGFYAIGCCRQDAGALLPGLFSGIEWSTSTVFTTIMNRLVTAGRKPVLLPTLSDIDSPEDLKLFERNRLHGVIG